MVKNPLLPATRPASRGKWIKSSATPGEFDLLKFSGAAYGGLVAGTLAASQFQLSQFPGALTADVRFIYSTATFGLFFDADGSGGAFSPELIAQIFTIVSVADILIF